MGIVESCSGHDRNEISDEEEGTHEYKMDTEKIAPPNTFNAQYKYTGNIIEENQYFTIRRIRSEYETHSVKIYKKDLGKTGNEECEDEEQSKILINMAHHEISTIKTLDHPNIIRIHEIYDMDKLYIVFDDVKGETLLSLINRKISVKRIFSEKEIACIMLQIISIVAHMHEKKLVHRDIKPESFAFAKIGNLLTLKLLNCFTATELEGTNPIREVVGSYTYMAPDVIKGEYYDEKCDTWSIGIIMYILICGQHPFADAYLLDPKRLKEYLLKKYKYRSGSLFNFTRREFTVLSEECIEFLKSLLEIFPKKRGLVKNLMNHPWLCGTYLFYKQEVMNIKAISEDKHLTHKFKCILAAVSAPKFKKLIWKKIGHTMLRVDRKNEFEDLFRVIDINGNGSLSREEMIKTYEKLFKVTKDDKIYRNFMKLKTAQVLVTDMLNAAILYEITFHNPDQTLRRIFHKFHEDNSQFDYITIEEIIYVFRGKKISAKIKEGFCAEMNLDKNLKMYYEQFKKYMTDMSHIVKLLQLP